MTGCDLLPSFSVESEPMEISDPNAVPEAGPLSDSPARDPGMCVNDKTGLPQDLLPSEKQVSEASIDGTVQDMVATGVADSQESLCNKQIEKGEESQTSSEHASTLARKTTSLETVEEDLIAILKKDMFYLIASAHWAERPSQSSKSKRKAAEESSLSTPSKRRKRSVTECEATMTDKDHDINIAKDVMSHSKDVSSVPLSQPTRPVTSDPGQTSSLLSTGMSLPHTQTVKDIELNVLSEDDSEDIDVLTVSLDDKYEQNSPVIISTDTQTDSEHDQDMKHTEVGIHFSIQHCVRVSDVQPEGTNTFLINNTEKDADIIKGANPPIANTPEMVLIRSSDGDISQSSETSLILIDGPPVSSSIIRQGLSSHSLNSGVEGDTNKVQETNMVNMNGECKF